VKLVRVIKICLNETYGRVSIGKYCWIHFLFRRLLYRHCFTIRHREDPRKWGRTGIE